MAQINDERAEPRGWAAPAFAHVLEAPLAMAPPEVQCCAPPLAQRDAPAMDDAMLRDLYAAIRDAADPRAASTALALRARFIVLLDGPVEVLKAEQMATAMGRVQACSPTHGAALCRTWLNGWSTGHRTQRGFRPCCFGCFAPAAQDTLSHLLCCPALWGAVEGASGLTAATTCRARAGLSASSPIRGGRGKFAAPPAAVLLLTMACDVYHRARLKGRRALAGAAADAMARLEHL